VERATERVAVARATAAKARVEAAKEAEVVAAAEVAAWAVGGTAAVV
jgi:hypothetical protein